MEETKQFTKKFTIGIALIAFSFVLGKIVLIPLIFFPNSNAWWISMIIIYMFSWIIMIGGVLLAGIEGFRFVRDRYKEYKEKTVEKVKDRSKKVASGTMTALKKPMKKLKENAQEKKAFINS